MSQRNYGSGSVYQRTDGRWVAAITIAGKRIVRYAKTRRDAQQRLQVLTKEYHLGTLTAPSHRTVSEWMAEWLEMREASLRASTFRAYRQALNPIESEIGHVKLHRATPAVLAAMFATLRKKGLGARRIQLSHGYVKQCLQHAVDLDLIGSNPMVKVSRPKWEPKQRRYWTIEEARRFLSTAATDAGRWSPLFTVLTTCGLRISEALGLTWTDVDFPNQTIRIERAMVWAGKNYVLGPTKTKAATRTISLPAYALSALQRIPHSIEPDAPVFRTETGNAPQPGHLRQPLNALCCKASVATINIHGLRHTAAALAFRATGDPYAVQRRLGHAHVSITIGIYGYGTRDDHEVAESLERLLDGGQPDRKTSVE